MGRRVISEDRKVKNKVRKNIVLIATEGKNKTEKLYLENFNDGKRNCGVYFINGNDTDPIRLVNGLKRKIQEKNLDLSDGDKAFCIFDTDTDIAKDENIAEAMAIAKESGIDVITSCPCVEIWFLLHFEYTTAYFNNRGIMKKLKRIYT